MGLCTRGIPGWRSLKMKTINLTEEEYYLLIDLADASLMEFNYVVTSTLQSLAIKLQMDASTMRWINQMLDEEETKDEKS